MGLSNSLREDTWIFRVKEKVDSCQLNVFMIFTFCNIPIACIDLAFVIIGMNKDCAPMSNAIDHVETFSWNWVERAILLLAIGNPLSWLSTVILSIVEWLEGKPIGWSRFWISIINALKT